MTLGQFINALELLKPDTVVHYDFGFLWPTVFRSYRGCYDHLALGFVEDDKEVIAESLIKAAKECLEKTFTGYNGREYNMDKDTPLWAANYGQTGSTSITGVRDLGYGYAIIETRYSDN